MLLYLKFNKSFFKILIKIPVGVTIRKNIIPIINGEITLPKTMPNLYQILFKGVNIGEFKTPKIKKKIATTIDQILISLSFHDEFLYHDNFFFDT